MPPAYIPRPKEWWNERRIEIYRLLLDGRDTSYIRKLTDEGGKHLFPGSQEVTNVKKAFDNHDDPFAKPTPPEDTGGDGSEDKAGEKPKPTSQLKGSTFVASVKPRVVALDPRLFILYDLTKVVFPEYEKDEGQWISDSIITFYSEHSDEFELGRLFEQAEEKPQPAKVEEGEHDNRETAGVSGTTEEQGEAED